MHFFLNLRICMILHGISQYSVIIAPIYIYLVIKYVDGSIGPMHQNFVKMQDEIGITKQVIASHVLTRYYPI
jgi:hypothetical protein